jgi:hypothetical protein
MFYVVGTARNKRLEALLQPHMEKAENDFESTKIKQRSFVELRYAAASWSCELSIPIKDPILDLS